QVPARRPNAGKVPQNSPLQRIGAAPANCSLLRLEELGIVSCQPYYRSLSLSASVKSLPCSPSLMCRLLQESKPAVEVVVGAGENGFICDEILIAGGKTDGRRRSVAAKIMFRLEVS